MNIAICDDDDNMRQVIVKLLKLAHTENGLDWAEPVGFSDGRALLAQYQQGARFDLLYLDIEMPEMNGMEAAAHIRALDQQVQLIFITSHEEYVFDAFGVQPVDYLTKPLNCRRFLQAFGRALANYRSLHQTIILSCGSGLKALLMQDILYVESAGKKAVVHQADGTALTVDHGISDLEQRLKVGHIIRCYRSYLVHLGYVREISAKQRGFGEGKEAVLYQPAEPGSPLRLAIGRAYEAAFTEAWMSYQQEGGWIRQ